MCKQLGLPNLADDQILNVNRIDLGLGQRRPIKAIRENDFYRLAVRSDKPEAKAFHDSVTHTVLPSIRKDGGYVMGEEKVATGEMSEGELAMAGYKALLEIIKEVEAKHARAVKGIDGLVARTTTDRQTLDEGAP